MQFNLLPADLSCSRSDFNLAFRNTDCNDSYHQRLCLEAWHFNSAHVPLNRDYGGFLPDAYLQLVKKSAAN